MSRPAHHIGPAAALAAALWSLPAAGAGVPCHGPSQSGLCATFWQHMTPERVAGIDPDARYVVGLRPLQLAATFSGDPAVIDALLEAGAPLEGRDANGNTALISSAQLSDAPAVVERLLAAGAEVTAANEEGETPLHAAAGATNDPAVIRLLLEAGASLEAEVSNHWDGATPLVYAARWNTNPAVVRTLLEAGADPGVTIGDGETALHQTAAGSIEPAVARTLVRSAGLAPNARDADGETPLHEAARNDRVAAKMIAMLVELGADIDARRRVDGRTALHVAASLGRAAAVQALLDAGASARLRDGAGERALDLAERLRGSPAYEALEAATEAVGI